MQEKCGPNARISSISENLLGLCHKSLWILWELDGIQNLDHLSSFLKNRGMRLLKKGQHIMLQRQ